MFDIRVRKRRHERHMSQQELSLRSGVSTSHISQIEADNSIRNRTPTLDVLERLSIALHTCPRKIVTYKCEQCILKHNCPEERYFDETYNLEVGFYI